MDPGQKLEIQINMAMDLVEDIEGKLEKLKDMLPSPWSCPGS
jgi:hypothetical protein